MLVSMKPPASMTNLLFASGDKAKLTWSELRGYIGC